MALCYIDQGEHQTVLAIKSEQYFAAHLEEGSQHWKKYAEGVDEVLHDRGSGNHLPHQALGSKLSKQQPQKFEQDSHEGPGNVLNHFLGFGLEPLPESVLFVYHFQNLVGLVGVDFKLAHQRHAVVPAHHAAVVLVQLNLLHISIKKVLQCFVLGDLEVALQLLQLYFVADGGGLGQLGGVEHELKRHGEGPHVRHDLFLVVLVLLLQLRHLLPLGRFLLSSEELDAQVGGLGVELGFLLAEPPGHKKMLLYYGLCYESSRSGWRCKEVCMLENDVSTNIGYIYWEMAEQPKQGGWQKVAKDFLLGGTAGAIAKTLAAPIERVKLLLQTQENNPKLRERPYKGIGDCFMRCAREEGVWSLWRGNWANVIRYFPTQAINFSTKDFLYQIFLKGVDPNVEKFKYMSRSLLSGGIAGSFSLLFVYPLDFARTRLGADIGKEAGEREFNGLMDCCAKIFKKDGIPGLYQGFSVSVAGIFTYRAFYFGGYDAGKRFIWGSDAEQKKASIFARFLFAQIITSSSETLAYPLDTIRRRLMMEAGKAKEERVYRGTIDCGQRILATEGVTGFFKGNLSNFWRSIGSSIVLVLYDELQKWVAAKGY